MLGTAAKLRLWRTAASCSYSLPPVVAQFTPQHQQLSIPLSATHAPIPPSLPARPSQTDRINVVGDVNNSGADEPPPPSLCGLPNASPSIQAQLAGLPQTSMQYVESRTDALYVWPTSKRSAARRPLLRCFCLTGLTHLVQWPWQSSTSISMSRLVCQTTSRVSQLKGATVVFGRNEARSLAGTKADRHIAR